MLCAGAWVTIHWNLVPLQGQVLSQPGEHKSNHGTAKGRGIALCVVLYLPN